MLNKLKTSAVVSTALMLLSAVPAYADDSQISGNGQGSDNDIVTTQTNTNITVQENKAVVENNVSVSGNSGGNQASGNTGGEVNVETGPVTAAASVDNMLNSNYAETGDCCPDGGDTLKINANGKNSDNDIVSTETNMDMLIQKNGAYVENNVEVLGNSGENKANGNTGSVEGDSDPSITTGPVDALVGVSTTANKNVSQGGDCGCPDDEDTLQISGNGRNSKNTILSLKGLFKKTFQKNTALVGNNVGVAGNTGGNQASGNTGGDVHIGTGGFSAIVSIFNKLNKNFAF